MLKEIIESVKQTGLEKYIDIVKSGDDQKILEFLASYLMEFKKCKITPKDLGILAKCKGKSFYLELSNASYDWDYYDIDDDNNIKLPEMIYVYNGKTLKSIKEINIRELNEKLIEIHNLLK
jgi:hypothetical protein